MMPRTKKQMPPGQLIKEKRIEKGVRERGRPYTQEELAKAIGVGVMVVSTWERGIRNPNRESVVRLAEFFGLPMESFVVARPSEATPRTQRARERQEAMTAIHTLFERGGPQLDSVLKALQRAVREESGGSQRAGY